MKHRIIRTENQMTIALAARGQFLQQNGATNRWTKLPKAPFIFANFQIGMAGIIATRKTEATQATYILPKDPRSHQFKNQWLALEAPFCSQLASNGMVCSGVGIDGHIYAFGHNIQNPRAVTKVPGLANPRALSMNAYGLFASSGTKTYMSANAGPAGKYGPWQMCLG